MSYFGTLIAVSFLKEIQADRESTRESFAEACVYAGQAVAATLLVLAAYQWADKPGGQIQLSGMSERPFVPGRTYYVEFVEES